MRDLCWLLILFSFHYLSAQTTVIYQQSNADFPNPERGFYRYSATHSDDYLPLDEATITAYRQLHQPFGADYEIYSTLVFRYFFLDDFKSSQISQEYLDLMQTDFNTARKAGIKLIPRIAYTETVNPNGCDNWICPPYGDAAKAWVLVHIGQLAPLFAANQDIIACIQMGFIGVWGENYYTDFFGDASRKPDFKLTDNNWSDRIEVLNALLDAVPASRMIQVRYPQMKQRTIYGITAPTTSAAMTLTEAFTGSDKARLGFHNDCLLASDADFGTYTDYGNSSDPSMDDVANLKPFVADDGQFVVVGGETCDDVYSPQNDCAGTDPLAMADTDLEYLHYSYLNAQYNNDVNNDWEAQGCMDNIKRRLGYRFELQGGTYSDAAQPGQIIQVDIDLKNTGFASPFNARAVELILINTSTSEKWYALLPDDPRSWFAGNGIHTIDHDLCIPPEMAGGTYELYLNLPDTMPLITRNPAYAIRLATLLPDNSDTWQESTGYNRLGHTVSIDNSAANAACNGEITFTATSSLRSAVAVRAKVFLQGPLNGSQMNTRLQTANIIQPYDPYGLNESVTSIPFGIVDWLKMELRDPGDHSTVLASRACFLRKDGQVVELDGTLNVIFPDFGKTKAHVVIRHRNHLPVMMKEEVVFSQW